MSPFAHLLKRHGCWNRILKAGLLSAGLFLTGGGQLAAQTRITDHVPPPAQPELTSNVSSLPLPVPTTSTAVEGITTPAVPSSRVVPAVVSPRKGNAKAVTSGVIRVQGTEGPALETPGNIPSPGASGDAPAPDASAMLGGQYRHNAFGGYTHFESDDGDFVLNFQNQVTIDGTFHDIGRPATIIQGFNVPFLRNYVYGNVLKDYEYLVSTQFFIDRFNILDSFVGYKFDDAVNFRFGHFLSPFLYEYWAFSPAWEPVITNSPLFQLAGKRQTGAMLWGKVLNNSVQYQAGVFNGPDGFYYDLDTNVDYMASMTFTPFKSNKDSIFNSLGFGGSVQTGRQDYLLSDPRTASGAFSNGEPTTQRSYIGSTGIAFLAYNEDVRAAGMRTKVAPHLFWFGQFSVLAEYVHWERTLQDRNNAKVNETVRGYQVTTSYFLTGESYSGDGLGGFTVVTPKAPFIPSKGQYGPGAWELSGQYSQMYVSNNVVDLGMVLPGVAATRLNQLMVGMNWWPNKYTRVSFDWMRATTNVPVDIGGAVPRNEYNVFWTRMAMFF